MQRRFMHPQHTVEIHWHVVHPSLPLLYDPKIATAVPHFYGYKKQQLGKKETWQPGLAGGKPWPNRQALNDKSDYRKDAENAKELKILNGIVQLGLSITRALVGA